MARFVLKWLRGRERNYFLPWQGGDANNIKQNSGPAAKALLVGSMKALKIFLFN